MVEKVQLGTRHMTTQELKSLGDAHRYSSSNVKDCSSDVCSSDLAEDRLKREKLVFTFSDP